MASLDDHGLDILDETPTPKYYHAIFADVSGGRHLLLISYFDDPKGERPLTKEARLGVPAVVLAQERSDVLSPVTKGRIAFSLVQEEASPNDYRHLVQAPEGEVSVQLFRLPDDFTGDPVGEIVQFEPDFLFHPDPGQNYGTKTDWREGYWRGTLDPESYVEPFSQDKGYLVQFEACDFGRLERVPFPAGAFPGNSVTLRDFIVTLTLFTYGTPLLPDLSPDKLAINTRGVDRALDRLRWAAAHFDGTGKNLWVDLAPFRKKERDGEYISSLEALERVLVGISAGLQQTHNGQYLVSDLDTLLGAEKNALKIYQPLVPASTLTPQGDDAEITALPALGSVTFTTESHLEDIQTSDTPPAPAPDVPWRSIPRAEDEAPAGSIAWELQIDEPVYRPEAVTYARPLRTQAVTTGEDGTYTALLWNTKSPHITIGRGLTLLWLNIDGRWETVQASRRVTNIAFATMGEDGQVLYPAYNSDQNLTSDYLINSYKDFVRMTEAEARVYAKYLVQLRDRLNSAPDAPGVPFHTARLSFPVTGERGGVFFRLDLPLLCSFSQDLFQRMGENTCAYIPYVHRGNPHGLGDWMTEKRNRYNAGREYRSDLLASEWGGKIHEARLYFDLAAKKTGGGFDAYLVRDQRGRLSWSTAPNSNASQRPFLSYGSYSKPLTWGEWMHPEKSAESSDLVRGDGLLIPIPPEGYDEVELTLYDQPHFTFKRDSGEWVPYREWALWSVPSLIVAGTPSLRLSDAFGREGSDLSPDRKERYTFTTTTSEDREETLHLSSGRGTLALSPAILRLRNGRQLHRSAYVSRLALHPRGQSAFGADSDLTRYRAGCYAATYASTPERGYELTGTFAYHPAEGLREYAGFLWLPLSREIDLQMLTERSIFHQLRRPDLGYLERLQAEILAGLSNRSGGAMHAGGTSSGIVYWNGPAWRPTPPRRR